MANPDVGERIIDLQGINSASLHEANLMEGAMKKKPKHLIGAKNPYAVARIRAKKIGETVPDWERLNPRQCQHLLAQLIGSGRSYKHLFDPIYGSCLFCPEVVEKVQKGLPRERRAELEREYSRDCSSVGAPPFANCSSCNYGGISGATWFSTRPQHGSIPGVNDDPDFNNPVQGPVYDCYLIAVLSSLAWVNDDVSTVNCGMIKTSAPSSSNPIVFYSSPNPCYGVSSPPSPAGTYVQVSLQLPLDIAGKPSCAISSEFTTAKEIWPSYYEKVYARYRESYGNPLIPACPNKSIDYPNICQLPCGDPFATLTLLTGKSCTVPDTKYDMMYYPDRCPRSADTIWGKLTSICYSVSGYPSQKTKYPAVAITNCTGDPRITGGSQLPCSAPYGSGVNYDNELLVASHSYSLLGIHTISNGSNAGNYVVLRNPYGQNPAYVQGSSPILWSDTEAFNFRVPAPAQVAPYNFSWPFIITDPGTGKKTPNSGVFAMKCTDFLNWFGAFGWITWS